MEIRKLDLPAARQVYDAYMMRDFPDNERKPFSSIEQMTQAGHYRCLGFYEGEKLAAYAFLCDGEKGEFSLLDYFAVEASLRGQGYGQRAMALLREYCGDCSGLIVESEDPAYAGTQKDRDIRLRRISFYKKCGLRLTGAHGWIYGVDYSLLYAACVREAEDGEIAAALRGIYRSMVSAEAFSRYVRITG